MSPIKVRLLLPAVSFFFASGCVHYSPPSNAERQASFAAYAEARIGNERAPAFMLDRSRLLYSGEAQVVNAGAAADSYRFIGGGFGTAAAIDPRGYLLTAAHCVAGKSNYLITFGRNGQVYRVAPVRVVWSGAKESLDLALVKVKPPPGMILKTFAWAADFAAGDEVLAAGIDTDRLKSGAVSALLETYAGRIAELSQARGPAYAGKVIYHTAPGHPGDSGGPLITTDGLLLGVNVAGEGIFRSRDSLWSVPFVQHRTIALRPDAAWLQKTIEEDAAAHPGT